MITLKRSRKGELREAFLESGWAFLHEIANGEICENGECFRCRLASLLYETEEKHGNKPKSANGAICDAIDTEAVAPAAEGDNNRI